jgi:hypothetical protein
MNQTAIFDDSYIMMQPGLMAMSYDHNVNRLGDGMNSCVWDVRKRLAKDNSSDRTFLPDARKFA